MKKLFTIDDFMIAFIAALGYGFGETISRLSGWSELACGVASFVLGLTLEEIVSNIAFSKAVQKNPKKRFLIYATIFLIFLVAHTISVVWMGVSMLDYLSEEFVYVVALPVLGFAVNLFIRGFRIRKIRKLYGDGSKGYVFNLKDKDLEEINKQNQPILGEYDADLAVKTRTGVYVGEKYKKTISYLGIPFAKPPVDELRWKAPEPLPSSDAVFEARYFGASAIQVEHKGSILKHHRQSEDCLTLNIAVGEQKTKHKKPVLVLFHHGDFTYGGSADPLLYGANFVEAHPDTVFVSFNYRLGIFGFIDFSKVPGGQTYRDAPNLGLLDQIAALTWIKENIAAFGGDPDQISVIGFDCGATSILLLAASGRAKGLFERAFVFNGSPVTAYDSPEGARALAEGLLQETQTSTMEDLLQLETDSLKAAAQRLWKNMCAPTCDGTLIPTDVYQTYQDGAASDIDFVIGVPSNEMQVFRASIGEQNFETLMNAAVDDMQLCLDDSVAAAVQAYIQTQTEVSTALEAKSKLIEQWNALCIYRVAVKLTAGGNRVHLLYWDEETLIENLGSGTIDAAATLLGNKDALQMYGSVMNKDLSETLQSLLQKFITQKALQLYSNEIKGVDAFLWKPFPQALIVSDGEMQCDTIGERITEIEELLNYIVQ